MTVIEALRSPRTRRFALLAALWVAIAAVLVLFRNVLLVMSVACLIAYVLQPAVRRMSEWHPGRFHLPRWTCVILLYAVFFAAVYLFSLTVVPQIYGELKRITVESGAFLNGLTPEKLNEYAAAVQRYVAERGIPLELGPADEVEPGHVGLSIDLGQAVRDGMVRASEEVKTGLPRLVGYAQTLVGRVLAFVFTFFFTLMIAAFVLVDWARIKGFVFSLFPSDHRERYDALLGRIDISLSGVVRGQIIICLVNGMLTLCGLLLLKVKFAFVLSSVAMVLSLIPIFGSILSSVPIVLIGLSQGWKIGFGALGWVIGIHALEAYFLNPKIMGAAAKIHPVLVAFALIAGERTFGIVGALFAVPVASILINVFKAIHHYALELHDRERVEPSERPPPKLAAAP